MEVNNQLQNSNYLPDKQLGKNNIDGIASPKFRRLILESQEAFEDRQENLGGEYYLKNRAITMLFLDKISQIIGKYHVDNLVINKFMGGDIASASMELIRYFSHLKNHPNLSEKSIELLDKWVNDEQLCLAIGLIFDRWAGNPGKEELEIFSIGLAREIQDLKPGDHFKTPAGYKGHATRLEFVKNKDGTFDILHFNTGSGAPRIDGKRSTACRYASIPKDKLENPQFWKKLVEAKFSPSIKPLLDLLDQPPVNIDNRLKKPLQEKGSCTFHSVEAEFKHTFITGFNNLDDGWQAYKQIKSLMTSDAVENASSTIDDTLARMLFNKDITRKRYLDWMPVACNPQKFEAAKNAYLNAIKALGYEIDGIDLNHSPLKTLSILDKKLNDALNYATFDQLIQIREKYGPSLTFGEINPIGFKQLSWLESTREVFQDIIDYSGWSGYILLKITNLSERLLPSAPNALIQGTLGFPVLKTSELSNLLTAYLIRQDLTRGMQTYQNLKDAHLIDDNFTFDFLLMTQLPSAHFCEKLLNENSLDHTKLALNIAIEAPTKELFPNILRMIAKRNDPEEIAAANICINMKAEDNKKEAFLKILGFYA